MTEYEVTFEITGLCKRTILARDDEDLWEQIEDAMGNMDNADIESVRNIEVVYVD